MGIFVDPSGLPDDTSGLLQVLFLGGVYAYVLFNASNMISDGSELLLLVPALAGIVGSIVLPVLGAVPDGAIVLFSGMGPDAQEQISVGVGALAGSTIMLLTLPWALSLYAGRVNLNADGSGNYIKPKNVAKESWSKLTITGPASLFHTGVVLVEEIASNAKTMMVTGLIYLILQVPAFQYTGTAAKDKLADSKAASDAERPFAFVAFLVCIAAFVGYLVWNAKRSSSVAKDIETDLQIEGIKAGKISLHAVLSEELEKMKSELSTEGSSLTTSKQLKRVATFIHPFFKIYDKNHDGTIDADEMMQFFKDMGEKVTRAECEAWIKKADKDKSGSIEFEELVEPVYMYLIGKYEAEHTGRKYEMKSIHVQPEPKVAKFFKNESTVFDDDEEEEDEEMPEDLANLSAEEQQRRIKIRAFNMMFVGTALVLLFSDPMVDVLSDVGRRTGIPAFYISFIVAPLASNASELIASFNYAQKKTSKTISISVSALLGAACMNNTFCLGIFAALMYFRAGLVWEFSAETISILFVELVVGLIALRRTQRWIDGLVVLSLYPLSIVLVYVLENVAGLD